MRELDLINRSSLSSLEGWLKTPNKPLVIEANSLQTLEKAITGLIKTAGIDVAIVSKEPSSKNISIDQIKEMKRIAKSRSHGSSTLLFMISGADQLSLEAQNSLLKLLEEPPYAVCFVLLTDSAVKLIPTINSRVQKISLQPTTKDEFVSYLQDGGVSKQEAELLYLKHQNAPFALIGGEEEAQQSLSDAKQFLLGTRLDKLKYTANIKDRGTALEFLDNVITVARLALKQATNKSTQDTRAWISRINSLQATHKHITQNGSVKANLDYLVINL